MTLIESLPDELVGCKCISESYKEARKFTVCEIFPVTKRRCSGDCKLGDGTIAKDISDLICFFFFNKSKGYKIMM